MSAAAKTGDSPRLEATLEMCFHCFETLVEELHGKPRSNRGRRNRPIPDYARDLPDPSVECPIFVTWEILRPAPGFPGNIMIGNSDNGQPLYDLRGCIGSLSPKPLITSVGDYALTSALRDRRFQPVTAPEIPALRVAVSLLVQYEPCEDCFDWIVGTHGILIRFVKSNREYSATYLPEVAEDQGWDQKQAVTALVRKAGYAGQVDHELFRFIQCTRYQSSKLRMTFEEYIAIKKQRLAVNGGPVSLPPTEPSSASSSMHQTQNPFLYDQQQYFYTQQQYLHDQQHHPQRWNTCNNL